jgi:uncharacterized protein YegJ (DUF2314 family)
MSDKRDPFDEPQAEPLFIALRNDDPAVLGAIDRARHTVDRFRELITARRGPETFHSAKLHFRDPEASARLGEDRFFYLWVSFVTWAEGAFSGTAVEVPKEIDWLHSGEVVRFQDDDVCDWMVNDNGRLFGGFSLRVTRAKLPEERRASFDRYIGVHTYERDA